MVAKTTSTITSIVDRGTNIDFITKIVNQGFGASIK